MTKQQQKKRHSSYAMGALLLIAVLVLGLLITFYRMNTTAVQNCYSNLESVSSLAASQVNDAFTRDRQHLKSLAAVIAASEDLRSDSVKTLLQTFSSQDLISWLAILYPDNTAMLNTGSILDVSDILSYADISTRGAYLSDVSYLANRPNQPVIRSFVPIVQDHQVVAMLYGVIFLNRMPVTFNISAYDGQARLCIVNGMTGSMIMNGWDESVNTLTELGKREFLSGGTAGEVVSSIRSGGSGNASFYSDIAGEPIYFHYQPLSINHWRVLLSVPKSQAFEQARTSRSQLMLLAVFYVLAFFIYTLWYTRMARKLSQEQESRLKLIQFMNTIEKTLFDFHLNPIRMRQALECVQLATGASHAFLLVWKDTQISVLFQSDDQDFHTRELMGRQVSQEFPAWYASWQRSLPVETSLFQTQEPERSFLRQIASRNFYALPVVDAAGVLRASLAVADWDPSDANRELMQKSVLSFAMALNNQESYFRIEQMGMLDFNTGLLNRNCYMNLLKADRPDNNDLLACIYADADGLHELNNRCGHDAGDRMLRAIADALRGAFPDDDHFRIGGDEFVSVISGQEESAVRSGVLAVQEGLIALGYHISAGIASGSQRDSLEELVNLADTRMLEEKRAYYGSVGDRRKE